MFAFWYFGFFLLNYLWRGMGLAASAGLIINNIKKIHGGGHKPNLQLMMVWSQISIKEVNSSPYTEDE